MKTTFFQLCSLQIVATLAANEINVLVYETDATLSSSNNIVNSHVDGLHAQIVGKGHEFAGFGSKYEAILPALEGLPASSITVISDGRDVLVNHASRDQANSGPVDSFVNAFEVLTKERPGAIVISAEAQCCVSALTHFAPGELFGSDGQRSGTACYSGKEDCLWNGDDKAAPWEAFMRDVAAENGADGRDDVYLNAGLMVGRASDLIRVLRAAAIGQEEDDQAVLTDFMYNHPDQIVLDYSQELFGNNRETCMFELSEHHLIHKQTKTAPLFIHTPGGSSTCHVELMAELGQKTMSKTAKRRLMKWKAGKINYKLKNSLRWGN